jgi:putative SOS response-associated peptidase YedK
MCGRFTDQYSWNELHELYGLSDEPPKSNFSARYNVAPTQTSFVVRETNDVRELAELRWGLLPKWAKALGDGARMIMPALRPWLRSPHIGPRSSRVPALSS